MKRQVRCGCDVVVGQERKFIRLIGVHAHTKIFATSSKTTLTQTFQNPSSVKPLEELRYVFPLFEGISVVGFTAHFGSQVVQGVVEEKTKATHTYTEAKDRGEAAGLLEQSLGVGDIFAIKIGNVPPGETITVGIEYLADLKHDAEADAIRFTIPTSIAPRYGPREILQADTTPVSEPKESFSVTIDAEMPDGSTIKSIQSPSHFIAVQIGTLSDASADDEPSLSRASASLSLEAAELAADFVVQIAATKLGEPSAVLETHPNIPNQRALMTTLVPKFNIPVDKPEIIFVCDRSGSMGSDKITKLKDALNVFLKSLPLGVKFNLVSFGSRYEFLWERSRSYDQTSLDEAIAYVDSFASNFGGTDIHQPLAETFKRRYKDMNLEVFLLTDGEISRQEELFKLINDQVAESKGAIRLFTVGIGRDASHALIQGAARAGNGFAQSVADNEQATTKFIRMLKGSLTPHILDYRLELKYRSASPVADDEAFELIEKVATTLSLETAGEKRAEAKDTISLFDPSASDDRKGDSSALDTSKALDNKYSHLPAFATPRYIQSPHHIPALFPFNRTTVYVLISDVDSAHLPESLLLRGTSAHGPLELEVPITTLPQTGTTIHQLAARNTVRELEEGRGWMSHASHPESGKPLKEEYEGRFSDMVEREAVKLGIKYQVTGKWTSFVAVPANENAEQDPSQISLATEASGTRQSRPARNFGRAPGGFAAKVPATKKLKRSAGVSASTMLASDARGPDMRSGGTLRGRGIGGAKRHRKIVEKEEITDSNEAMGFQATSPLPSPMSQQYHGSPMPLKDDSSDEDMGFALMDDDPPAPKQAQDQTLTPLQHLISLQRFDGSWTWSKELADALGVGEQQVSKMARDDGVEVQTPDVLATVAVILFFQRKLASERDTWDMIVNKAEGWVEGKDGPDAYKGLRRSIWCLFD